MAENNEASDFNPNGLKIIFTRESDSRFGLSQMVKDRMIEVTVSPDLQLSA